MPLRIGGDSTAIKNLKVNTAADKTGGSDMNRVIINGTVMGEKVIGSFTGLTGSTPSSYTSQTVIADEDNIVSPGTPLKTGYTCTGGNPSLPRTISLNTSFSPVGSTNNYIITYVLNGGTNNTSNPTSYNIESSLITFAAPTKSRTGYTCTFIKWTPTSIAAGSTGAVTTTATWNDELITYSISYTMNGGTNHPSNPSTYNITTPTITFATPTKPVTGYTNTFTGGSTTSISLGSTGNKTTTASWSANVANTYTVTYNGNGHTGGSTASTSHTYGTSSNIRDNGYSKSYYYFAGWATSAGGAVVYGDGASVLNLTSVNEGSVTLYAKWTPLTYAIYYTMNGGVNNGSNPSAYNITTPTITFATPTKTPELGGNTSFTSWSPTTIPLGSTGNKTIVANWNDTPISYGITYELNGGTNNGSNPTSYQITSSTITFQPATKTGSTFVGGCYDAGLTTIRTQIMQGSTGAVKVYAKGTLESYTINTVENGGSTVANITGNYGSTITQPPNPTKNYHTFGGGYSNTGLTTAFNGPTTMPDYGDPGTIVNIYAKGNPIEYNLMYGKNNVDITGNTLVGTPTGSIPNQPIYYNETENITVSSYSLFGYVGYGGRIVNDAELAPLISPGGSFTMSGPGATIFQQGTPNSYAIKFKNAGGYGLMADQNITYGTSAVIKANTINKTGYYMNSGYSDGLVDELYVPVTYYMNVGGDTLSPVGKANTYYVAYNGNGQSGSSMSNTTHVYDTPSNLRTNSFYKVGHTFLGGATDPSGAVVYSDGQSVTDVIGSGTKTLYAKGQIITTTVTFNANGGSGGPTPKDWKYGYEAASLPGWNRGNMPTKAGNSFGGYYETSSGTGYQYVSASGGSGTSTWNKTTSTYTIYAKGTINNYTVTFDSNGGTSVSSKTQQYNSSVTKPTDPTKSSYVFGGWYYSETSNNGTGTIVTWPFNMPAGNQTIYARWNTAIPDGLSGALITIPAQNSTAGEYSTAGKFASYDASAYIGSTVALVIRYEASSWQGDAQFDNFKLGSNTWEPDNGVNAFLCHKVESAPVTDYSLVEGEDLITSTSGDNKFLRDSGGTASTGTGNTSGYDGQYYYYAETSGATGGTYWLRSPSIVLTTSTLSFYYAQNGPHCGSIRAYLDVNPAEVGGKTASPTIIDYTCAIIFGSTNISWKVHNNSSKSAVIRSETGTTNPKKTQTVAGSSDSTGFFNTPGVLNNRTYTIYATAQATGDQISDYSAQSISTSFCPVFS